MGNFMKGKGCWGSMMNEDELKASQISWCLLQHKLTGINFTMGKLGWADS